MARLSGMNHTTIARQVRRGMLALGLDSGVHYIITSTARGEVTGVALHNSTKLKEIEAGHSVIISAGSGFELLNPGTEIHLEQDS